MAASGRGDWIGWAELKKERVNELATEHTARVIKDVAADVLGVVEAESRITLKHFTDAGLLEGRRKPLYPHVMVIDGNDDRGIDVGILTRPTFPIVGIRSHVDDLNDKGNPLFSRDCAVYTVQLPSGKQVASI